MTTPGEGREAVARIIDPVAFSNGLIDPVVLQRAERNALEKADAILALLRVPEELSYTPDTKTWRYAGERAPEAAPGWQLVPKVLTGEWLRKVSFYADNECMYREKWAQNMWDDVLSAAPSAPSVDSGVSETHEWFRPDFLEYDCCRKCGIVRRADGKNKPCKGVVYLRSMETPFTRLEYSGWLIERDCADGIEYVHTFADWTRDANKALRFNRKGDAEDTVQIFFDEVDGVRVAEHAWSDPAPSEIDRAIAEQDAFERDAETISAEVNHLPEVSSLPDRCGEDVWPLVERALVAVGRHYRTALPVADARNEGIEEAAKKVDYIAEDYAEPNSEAQQDKKTCPHCGKEIA